MGIFDILNFYNINKRVKLNIKSFQVKNSVKFKKLLVLNLCANKWLI